MTSSVGDSESEDEFQSPMLPIDFVVVVILASNRSEFFDRDLATRFAAAESLFLKSSLAHSSFVFSSPAMVCKRW